MKAIVTVIGRDKVGITAAVCALLAQHSINILDISQTVLQEYFTMVMLVDTGGIETVTDDVILKQMRRQAEIAIETCDVILFFVDGKTGLTADDQSVADMLRRSGKPVMLVVNKVDNVRMMDNIYEFYNLGIGDPIGVSSINLLNFGDLLEELCKFFPDPDAQEETDGAIRIAVAGKPNVCWAKTA